MLTSRRRGFSDGRLPQPFPDIATADGISRPNRCVLIQDAILVMER